MALANLFKEALREITELSCSANNLTQTSINVRNIFELYIVSRHVCSDEGALQSWLGQSHKDQTDINIAFKALAQKKKLNTKAIDESQRNIDNILKESPFSSKGPFNMKTVATLYGYEDDYNFVYKFSSKLIHPSSMKVNAYDALIENDNYFKTLLQIGVYFSQKIEALIVEVKNGKTV